MDLSFASEEHESPIDFVRARLTGQNGSFWGKILKAMTEGQEF